MEKRWQVLSETSKPLREILIKNRKIEDQETFFQPHLHKLTSPDKFFPDLDKAIERLRKAIKNKELIYIYGDFDVDGITGCAILWETINSLGGKVLPYIPHREKEGYGIHSEAITTLAKEGAGLIISVDCGITAVEEAKIAKNLSVDLIITDHHTKQAEIPESFALLHTDKLAGSGVAFMLAKALLDSFSKGDEQFFKNLELATIGTIADMVPLQGDNRIITANGLLNLRSSERVGLKALYAEAGVTNTLSTFEVGFLITPRLNAAGRMETAMDSLRLLLTRKETRAREIARGLSQTNKERQEATASALNHAREVVAGNGSSKMIVVHHPSYLAGIIGLVAGRLVDEFYRPAIVISETSPLSKGSGRSISGFNITEALSGLKEHLTSHGGHPMAAGFSLEEAKIPHFKEEMLNYAEKNLLEADLTPTLKIDARLEPEQINQETLGVISEFAPFGIGNPEPVFMAEDLLVMDERTVGKEGKHLKMVLKDVDSRAFDAIGFGQGGKAVTVGDKVDAVFTLNENIWNGQKNLQLKVKDLRKKKDPATLR